MSHWHYQVMRHTDSSGEEYYAIHEYYEMDDGDGWAESPVDVTGESIEDLRRSLLRMYRDINKHGVRNYD